MNVLLLSWEYPPVMVGGLGRHVYALSKALAAAGHTVTVVTRHAPGAPWDEHREGVRVVRVPEDPPLVPLTNSNLLTWAVSFNHTLTRVALRVAAQTPVDVVHAHDWLVAHSAITLRAQLGLPLVTTIHATEAGRHQGWLPKDLNKSVHSVESWLAGESDRVVVCSHYMRWEVNHLFGVPPDRIDVIPNGVEPQLWQVDQHAVDSARLRYSGAGPLLGFAGRLVYEKGVQDLITALPELRALHPGLRLVVAGDGPHRPELQEQVGRLNLHRVVSFAGFLGSGLAPVMAAADTMVVPSLYEPFGMIALEAAAAGTPVAAASTGGLKEFVEPGRTGMTFIPGDSAALARMVSRLLSDTEGARRMARTANRVVIDRYSWDAIAARTARLYGQVAGSTAAVTGPVSGPGRPKIVVPDGNLLQRQVA
ncbi:glycosyltransferase family 4 protein [Planosporangium sp. 12N6]|uniref:glycosyltransferase family 4 protein n=1 Tax=Planosporangium spinosum TaxID=3402278 RepID=UPI003CF6BE29